MRAAVQWPHLPDAAVIIAFCGWNDAGDAASDALEHVAELSHASDLLELDLSDFIDYQQIRPHILTNEQGERAIEWPTVRIRMGRLHERNLILIDADEPNYRWQQFADDLARDLLALRPTAVIFLGSMLEDVPHTRPTPVYGSSTNSELAARTGFTPSTYEGPTGIVGVLSVAFAAVGLDVTSLWAGLPHYISHAPSPKAVVALLNALEDVLETSIDVGDFLEQSRAWQRRCDELASEDEELADYIRGLEAQHDDDSSMQATGDAIAKEFERYLRRRGEQT